MAAQGLDSVISHWSTLIENFQASPLAFYQGVEAALIRRQLPETKNCRIDHREAGILSANREYLHVTRESFGFDICGAPFGTGFFVSWWLTDDTPQLNPIQRAIALFVMLGAALWMLSEFGLTTGAVVIVFVLFGGLAAANTLASGGDFNDKLVQSLPLVGVLYEWLFKPQTFYRLDTMAMFQKAVHSAVLEVIDTMTTEKGVRALADADRKPIMREFYSRK
jgi:hypothetical protein